MGLGDEGEGHGDKPGPHYYCGVCYSEGGCSRPKVRKGGTALLSVFIFF